VILMVLSYPLTTEKAVRFIDTENKIIFVVHPNAKKADIKKAVEEQFNAKVLSVNTFNAPNGEKRAYVKFSNDSPAIDIATKLGLM